MLHTGLGQFIPLVCYLAAVLGCLLALFKDPRIGFYVLIPLIPMQRLRTRLVDYPLGANVVTLLTLAVILGLLFRRAEKPSSALNKVLLAFSLFIYLSLWQGAFFLNSNLPLWLTDPRLSDYREYVMMFALCPIAAACCKTKRDVKIAIGLIVFTLVMANRSFILEAMQHTWTHFDEEKRDAGPMGFAGSNGFAAFEVQLTMVMLALAAFEPKRLRRFGWYALLAFNVLCVVYSFSRAAYFAAAVGVLLFAVMKKRILLLPLVVGLLLWQVILPTAMRERIQMTKNTQTGEVDTSAAERLALWEDASKLIADSPVIGSGWDTYKYMGRHETLKDTHNYFLKVLVETGMVGMCFFIALLATMAATAWRLYRSAQDTLFKPLGFGLLLLMCTLLILNFFGDRWSLIEINGFVWILFGLAQRGIALCEADESSTSSDEIQHPDEELVAAV